MKHRNWKFAFLVLLPLALYAFIAERNSWRPKTIVVAPGIWLGHLNFSPDGRYFVVSSPNNSPETTYVCEVASRRVVCELPSTFAPTFLSKQCLAVGEYEWDELELPKQSPLPSGIRLVQWPVDFHPVGFLPDGQTILGNMYRSSDAHEDTEQIWVWSPNSKKPPHRLLKFETRRGSATCYCFPDAGLLRDGITLLAPMTIAHSRTKFHSEVHLWNINTKRMLPLEFDREMQQMDLDSRRDSTTDGRLVALDWGGGGVKIWNYKTGIFLRSMPLSGFSHQLKGPGTKLVISPDGKMIAVSDPTKGAVVLWNLDSGGLLRRLSGIKLSEDDNSIKFSPDGRFIVSCHKGIVQVIRIK